MDNKLLKSLINLGVENNFLNLIRGIFKNHTISIIISDEISNIAFKTKRN